MKYIKDLNERVRTKLNVSQTIINVAIIAMLVMLIGSILLGVKSCSSSEYSFSSQSDAITCYRDYLNDIRKMESVDASRCSSEINKWFIARLNDNRKEMLVFVILTLLIAWAPHLITLAITFGIITIGVTFYPSKLIRSIDRYMVTTEYCRSMVTGNYSRFINCYFA